DVCSSDLPRGGPAAGLRGDFRISPLKRSSRSSPLSSPAGPSTTSGAAMTDTYADLLACEDVLRFANAAISGTGQREFLGGPGEQLLTLDFLHSYVRVNHRDLYAAVLALDVNDHNAARIVHGLLSEPAGPGAAALPEEGALIARRLADLPPQRAYRLFRRLAADRVNNRRTRAVIAQWLRNRPDPAF